MKYKFKAIVLCCALIGLLLTGCKTDGNQESSSNFDSNSNSNSSENTNPGDFYPEEYYQSISVHWTGAELRSSLYDLMIKTHTTYVSYSGLRDVYPTSDEDPNQPGNIFMFYTNTSRPFNKDFTGNINREHVWPKSKGVGESGPGSDAHHLRPCDMQLNSARGNLDFDEVPNGSYCNENGVKTENKKNSTAFEPQDSAKGQVARILFYVAMHYGPDSSYGLEIVDQVGLGSGKKIGKLSTLLKWNLEFPVDEIEQRRNEAVADVQGNRNPFIDHPEFACKIWGDYNAATKAICN